MVLAIWAKRFDKMIVEPGRDGLFAKLAQACYGICFYVAQTVFPVGIAGYYPRPEGGAFYSAFYVSLIGVTIAGGAAVYAVRRRYPWLLAASASFVAMLAPHLGFIRVGNTIAADRYCYAASTVLTVLAGLGICRLLKSNRRVLPILVSGSARF